MPIRVRFAPSPTGFLHVGGARTAIFNWLFAENTGGSFLLRIEDTDPGRSKSELSAQIIRTMQWLGMDADEPVVYQSDHISRYKEIAELLVSTAKAYYAFETPEELDVKRKEAEAKKIPYNYDRASLSYSHEQVKTFLSEGKPFAIRFKVPEGITEFDDLVHGKTSFSNSGIEDFVILRSDGSPTYQIAVVCDDHDMNISHIIRGDDHLSNTPKQIMLYNALGWTVPVFAHLPMILDEQKKKLSKRRNTVAVEEYKEQGYLADALFNFLTLLGFAAPPQPSPMEREQREILSRDELISLFTFDRVNKKSSVFDTKKLNWLNFEYIKNLNENDLLVMIREMLAKNKINVPGDGYLLKMISLMKPRVEKINDFYETCKYFYSDPENYDGKAAAKHWNDNIKPAFNEYFQFLKNSADEISAINTEEFLRKFCEEKNIKPGSLIHVIRIALTGSTASPGIFELMEVLGKETVVRRIEKFIQHPHASPAL